MEMLGLDEENPEQENYVRRMYATYGNGDAPGNQADESVVFITIEPYRSLSPLVHDISYVDHPDPESEYGAVQITREALPWKVTWSCYGPDAVDRANLIRHKVQIPSSLDRQHVALLFFQSPLSIPVRRPELIDEQWVDRWDFECIFHEALTRRDEVQSIEAVEPPAIDINS